MNDPWVRDFILGLAGVGSSVKILLNIDAIVGGTDLHLGDNEAR